MVDASALQLFYYNYFSWFVSKRNYTIVPGHRYMSCSMSHYYNRFVKVMFTELAILESYQLVKTNEISQRSVGDYAPMLLQSSWYVFFVFLPVAMLEWLQGRRCPRILYGYTPCDLYGICDNCTLCNICMFSVSSPYHLLPHYH
jgi:hypothetical protein